ncbi:MAG: hypothetical protein M1840_002396 [Geoglossum simile]|nr:MAG: hypothetical protein M1840_002396 [Geoglossum simile]
MPNLINRLRAGLLPALRRESLRPRVIVLDNNSTHIDSMVTKAIESKGHIVCFLHPYSPDFNPIKLSFSVLKAWFQCNYIWTRSNHENFGEYLVWAISHSHCDRFVREQFRHAANGLYLEEEEYECFQKSLRDWEQEPVEAMVEIRASEWAKEDLQEVEEDLQRLEGADGVEGTEGH